MTIIFFIRTILIYELYQCNELFLPTQGLMFKPWPETDYSHHSYHLYIGIFLKEFKRSDDSIQNIG